MTYSGPLHLELDLLFLASALVLDVEGGPRRDVDALPGDLDREPLVVLEGVRQSTELGHELGPGIGLLDVATALGGHGVLESMMEGAGLDYKMT